MTADEAAKAAGVVGWVKNLPDGRVELVAEASEETLSRFLNEIRTGAMKNFIADVDICWSPACHTFHEFTIRYY
jgi:acylphosphatase